jgi:hypothetical protein
VASRRRGDPRSPVVQVWSMGGGVALICVRSGSPGRGGSSGGRSDAVVCFWDSPRRGVGRRRVRAVGGVE